MSDLRLFNTKQKECFVKTKLDKVKMQAIIEENIDDLLGLQLVISNYKVESHQQEIIETIAIDENYQLTIIEYRYGKFGQTINKGLFYLDYIKNNVSEFKILVSDKLNKKIANQVFYNPRLICIGDDFNRYDEYAVSQLRHDIDLIKIQSFTKGYIILEKAVQGIKQFKYNDVNHSITNDELLQEIRKFVLSLGDEVVESEFGSFICYRRIRNFMYITIDNNLTIQLRLQGSYRAYQVNTLGEFNRLKTNIESAYDQN